MEEKNTLNEKIKKYEKYVDLYKNYEKDKLKFVELNTTVEKNDNFIQRKKLESEILMKRIEETEKYFVIEQKNKEIEMLIKKKEMELKELKSELQSLIAKFTKKVTMAEIKTADGKSLMVEGELALGVAVSGIYVLLNH